MTHGVPCVILELHLFILATCIVDLTPSKKYNLFFTITIDFVFRFKNEMDIQL